MTQICAKYLPRGATTVWAGGSLVRYGPDLARWSITVRCGFDLLASLAAVQPPRILGPLSQGDPRDRPAQIREGATDFSFARTAHRGSRCFGIALANCDSGKSFLPGTLHLLLRRALHLQSR